MSPNALWVRVVKAIYGERGLIDEPSRRSYRSSVWVNVIKAMESNKEHGVDLLGYCSRKIGDGRNTKFWTEKWDGNSLLKDRFPRMYALEVNKLITVASKKVQGADTDSLRRRPRGGVESEQWTAMQTLISGIKLTPMEDRWVWTLESSGIFTVRSSRIAIDKGILISNGAPTRWCKLVPNKVNIMV